MSEPAPQEAQQMLALARKLALDAADLAIAAQHDTVEYRKPDTSVVTQADHDAQRLIFDGIRQDYSDHATIGEEATEPDSTLPSPQNARFCWVVDPIDGTRNYVAGFPCFSTSIGILDRGRPIAGVIVEHNLRDIYAATLGGGATLNGQPIRVAEPRANIMVAGPSSKDRVTVAVQKLWVEMRGLVGRNTGSAAVHLAMVAAGRLDGAFANRCKIWDVAAGALIVNEAGGRFTDLTGQAIETFDLTANPGDNIPFLAGSPKAHGRLLKTIREALDAH